MAHTAQGTLAEIIQSTEGMRLSPEGVARDIPTSVKIAYQQLLDEREARAEMATEGKLRPTAGPAYEKLDDVLQRAYTQSSAGKGKDRHVKDEGQAFEDQPICSLQRIYGTGYAFGQVGKKMEESMRLPKEQAVAELLGAIVYIAAAVVVIEEG